MHPISFLQKRQHLCAVARGREMFAHIEDMTPARFDILYTVYKNVHRSVLSDQSGFWIEQSKLRDALGLARQTVWKGVKRLIELGLLESDELLSDGRGHVVRLTKEGVRRLRQALNAAFSERAPLPLAAPGDGDVPRYWKRPELADVACIGSNGVITGKPTALPEMVAAAVDPKFVSRDPKALKAAGLPPGGNKAVLLVPKKGREVERIFTSFAWRRLGSKRGRRGKRRDHLNELERLIDFMDSVATALGNTAPSIYTLGWSEKYH